jgi:hypothetical protein
VSNPIRYDPVLVRGLARELHAALAGRACHPLPVFDARRRLLLHLDRGATLAWSLHPGDGRLRLGEAPAGTSPAACTARIVRVHAPPDERLLRIDLLEGGRFRGAERSIVVELHTNQWNALVVDRAGGRIVSALRARRAGDRALVPGEEYRPPPAPGRIAPSAPEADGRWDGLLAPLPPEERPAALVRHFAWTSPLNAGTVLAPAAGEAGLDGARERWRAMAGGEGAGAFLLRRPGVTQPYPFPLAGWAAVAAPSLLEAMANGGEPPVAAEAEAEAGTAAAEEAGELLAGALRRLAAAERRLARLGEEVARPGEAERLRGAGDLILAHLHLVPPGAERAVLPAFDGETEVEVALDPALRPHENAGRYYDLARRRARAEERLPVLIAEAEAERDRWSAGVASLEAGAAPPWLAAALHRAPGGERSRGEVGERLPYRGYRTSGGLEVRVGRTSRDNDRLTFHHASPGDVWLHARSVAGSHVVLRWTREEAPPARDLEEAAVLAALHSKARTSGTVAVDWTRRRYVRKPRGAPPGRVSLLRARTLFVEPDPAVEERMRQGE